MSAYERMMKLKAPQIIVRENHCIKCGSCTLVCPEKIFVQSEKGTIPQVVSPEKCIICGQCAAACPSDAVDHEKFSNTTIKPLNRKLYPTDEQILEAIRGRRSIRAFKEKAVEKEKIDRILDAARLAPSAKNSQSTEFIVVQDKENLKKASDLTVAFLEGVMKKIQNPFFRTLGMLLSKNKIEKAIRSIPSFQRIAADHREGKDRILRNAPALILFHGKKSISFSNENANLCLQNATFMAETLGLGTFYTGYLIAACQRDKAIPQFFNIPENHGIFAGMTLGYPQFNQFPNWIERNEPKVRWL